MDEIGQPPYSKASRALWQNLIKKNPNYEPKL